MHWLLSVALEGIWQYRSIISDTSKFKVNDNDPTLRREGKLQRNLAVTVNYHN